MKIYINDLGHMTNMAAMPIYGKTPNQGKRENYYFLETIAALSLKVA